IYCVRAVTSGQNVTRRGADITAGSLVVRSGELMTPSRVGALAAVGIGDVLVYNKPRVAILSTGNEVVEPGLALEPGQIYDVNRFPVGRVVAAHGGVPQFQSPASDTIDSLSEALDRAAEADIIIFSGGSSVGNRDLIADLLGGRGETIFHGIAVRPGKPTA